MRYAAGSVIRKKNIKFKGTDKLDFRMGGHPVLVPCDVFFEDGYHYYLTASSQTQYYINNEDRYYLTSSLPSVGLPQPSIIDLEYAYKCESQNITCREPVDPEILREILDKMVAYSGKQIDDDYEELLSAL